MAPLRQWLSTYMPVYTYSFLGLVLLLLLLSCFSRVRLCATPWTAAHRAPPSPGFSRQEYSLTQLPPLLASLKVICSVKCRSHSFSEPLLLLLPYPTSPLFWTSFPFRRMWPCLETDFYRNNQVKIRWSSAWTSVIQYDWCPYKNGEIGHGDGHRRKTTWRFIRRLAKWRWRQKRIMFLQAKECQRTARKWPEAQREAWNGLSLRALSGNQPCWDLDLGLVASRTVWDKKFLVL